MNKSARFIFLDAHNGSAMYRMILALVLLTDLSIAVNVIAADDGPQSSGTGFVVSRQGHILTNYHVVEGCASIRANIEGAQKELPVVGIDPKNDLAVLKLAGSTLRFARFREGRNIRAGDSVVLVGFPLHGVLASEANVTTGTVSALAGIGNDTRFLQMTAPVQPGNSGGPVFDQSGQIVGVVVSKLDALKVAKVTGDIPQNINFAINGAVAKAFLDSHGVTYETAASEKKLESAEIGSAAKQFTFLLECYSEKLGAEYRALEAERRALEAERRALDDERRALAEAHERALRLEQEERTRQAQVAAEQQRLQREKELVEAQAASERVIRFHEQERAEEARRERIRQKLEEGWLEERIQAIGSINGKDGAPMVLVPEGEFLYGDNNQRQSLPAFYMDKFEVTTRLYSAFLQATGREQPVDWSQQMALVSGGDRPVVTVSSHDAEAYCRHNGKRLPTEQEWEKAARGTDGRMYPWGNEEPTSRHALFNTTWNDYGMLAVVGSHEAGASPYGIHDLAGNVWEWTSSDYDGSGQFRVLRGGSWIYGPVDLRSANRLRDHPTIRYADLGFRCAQDAR